MAVVVIGLCYAVLLYAIGTIYKVGTTKEKAAFTVALVLIAVINAPALITMASIGSEVML